MEYEKIKKIRSHLLSWFKQLLQKKQQPSSPASNAQPSSDSLESLLESVDKGKLGSSFSFIPEGVATGFINDIKEVIALGFNDGITGKPSTMFLQIASLVAHNLFYETKREADLKNTALMEDCRSQRVIVKQRQHDLHAQYAYNRLLQHYYRFNERGNTIGEFFLYLTLFILLLVADIPIGVQLMQTFFKKEVAAVPFAQLFEPGQFLPVLRANWEAVLTALGVAIGAVYIKIGYDEFVGTKYGLSVLAKKRFETLFAPHDTARAGDEEILEQLVFSTEEKARIEKRAFWVRRSKVAILIFTLLVLVMISLFRVHGWFQSVSDEELSPTPRGLVMGTMIALTLFFAVLSGICLSIALGALINHKRLRDSRRETTHLEKALGQATAALARVEKEEKEASEYAREHSWREWEKNIQGVFKSYYEMGYHQGRLQPGYYMRDKDHFDRISYARDEDTALRIAGYLTNEKSL